MDTIWNNALQKTKIVNEGLQKAEIDLCTTVKLYDALLHHFRDIRYDRLEKLETMETMARGLNIWL
jgi:hypothetical protein